MSSPTPIPDTPELEQESAQFRSQMGHISRHSLVFFGGTLFSAAAGYVFKIYLARTLGAEKLGLYALGMTFVGFFSVFGGLGLPQSAVRFVAAFRARNNYEALRSLVWKGTGILVLLNLVLGAAIVLVGPAVAWKVYRTPALVPYFGLFATIMLLGAVSGFWSQILVGFRDVSSRAIINNVIGSALIIVLTVVFFTVFGKDLKGYLLAQIANPIIVLCLLVAVGRRRMPIEARGLARRMDRFPKEVLGFSTTVFGIDFMKFLLAQSDRILIGMCLTAGAVGVYSVAASIVVYVAIVLQSVNQIFSPTIASLHAQGEHQLLGRLFQTLTKWILGLTLPLASVVIIFSRPIMHMFGTSFEQGWLVLVLGALGQLVSCGVGSVGMLLLMSDNEQRLLRVQVWTTVAMLVLSVTLIPVLGIVGAAVAAMITNVARNIWNLRQVQSALGYSPYNRSYAKLIVPALAMLLLLGWGRVALPEFQPQGAVIVLAVLVAYAVFVGGSLLFGLDEDDRLIVDAMRGRMSGMLDRALGNS